MKKRMRKWKEGCTRRFCSLHVASRFVPSEIRYWDPDTYQVTLHRMLSPGCTAVAVEVVFTRVQPFVAVLSDDHAVAVRFAVPSPRNIDRVVVVYALPVGVLDTSRTQFVPSGETEAMMPIDCGVQAGPLIRADTITYSTAARTTVIATMRMVAITGDTAASSLRMTFFIGFVLLRLSPLPHTGDRKSVV